MIEREMRRFQRRVAAKVRAASPLVRAGGGALGGSLVKALRSRALLKRKRWGVVLEFSQIGAKLRFFIRGTKRQKARPIKLTPDIEPLSEAIRADAVKHFEERDKQTSRGRR